MADAETYPLQKKGHSFEFLRTIAHLRPRTNTFGAVARVRNCVCNSIHQFFQEEGFFYLHTPIITASDCEGAGAMFQVTTLDLDKLPREGSNRSISTTTSSTGRPISPSADSSKARLTPAAWARSTPSGRRSAPRTRTRPRHLAEFWMVEPETAFYDLYDNMDLAERFLKRIFRDVLEKCPEDMQFFNERIDKTVDRNARGTLSRAISSALTYTEAIEILEKSGQTFEFPVAWGTDLQSEHERFLTEKHFKCPVILYDYPRTIKPFYMRLNDDGKTVRAMDVLVPKVGEIIGGSQREERLDVLEMRMAEQGLNPADYWWYSDLRRYGTVPHAGFGLGVERVLLFITGMANIRDVIPFPRTPGNAEF